MPTIESFRNLGEIAGQRCIEVKVKYPDEPTYSFKFYGYPTEPVAQIVVTESATWGQRFVTDPGRFGLPFGQPWIAAYFAD